jgi:hypothetical protein
MHPKCCLVLTRTQAARLGRTYQCSAAVGYGMIEQFEHEAKGCEVFFVDGVIVVALERVADNGIDLALHQQQFLDRCTVRTFEIIAMILVRSSVISSRSSRLRN